MNLTEVKRRIDKRNDDQLSKLENQRVALFEKLRDHLPEFLEKFPAVTKVIIIGSLTRPGYFTQLSDVDIVLQDLPNSKYSEAFGWFENCLKFENIDLIRIEDAIPNIMKWIEKGAVLYEKKN